MGVGGNGVCLSSVQLFLFWSHFGCTGKPLGLLGGGERSPRSWGCTTQEKILHQNKTSIPVQSRKEPGCVDERGAQRQGVRVKGKAHCIYCCCVRRIKLSQKTHSSVFGSETRTTCFPTWGGGFIFSQSLLKPNHPLFAQPGDRRKLLKSINFGHIFNKLPVSSPTSGPPLEVLDDHTPVGWGGLEPTNKAVSPPNPWGEHQGGP